jgi:hypothetical protein
MTRTFEKLQKFFEIFLPGLWKFCVFQRGNNRGGKLPERRARSPPPFLGTQLTTNRKRTRGYDITFCPVTARRAVS